MTDKIKNILRNRQHSSTVETIKINKHCFRYPICYIKLAMFNLIRLGYDPY